MSKRTVRRGVFETNSSSTHSITICTGDDYSKWQDDEMLLQGYPTKLITMEEVKELYKNDKYRDEATTFEEWLESQYEDSELQTYEKYTDNYEYEQFKETFTTPSGDNIVAFGYYGADY